MRIGIYYVVSELGDHQKRLDDFGKIKALGVNAIATYLLTTPADTKFVNRCARNNIALIVERGKRDTTLTKLRTVMNKYGDKIAGIISYDDVDSPKTDYPLETVKAMNSKIMSLWPDKRLYVSGGYVNRIGRYTTAGQDITLFQGYPIGNGSEDVATAGNYYWSGVNSHLRPWGATVQSFAWAGQRYPTEQEIRSMTYQALSFTGCKELWFYTYADPGQDLTDEPKKRYQLKRIINEVKIAKDFWTR